MLRVCIGYDAREPLAFAVCAHSIQRRASAPVEIVPVNIDHLRDHHTRAANGTTAFSLTRFLTPWLSDYKGMAVFMDCDMLVQCDLERELINEIVRLEPPPVADVWVCPHDYTPRAGPKATGTVNAAYPRKNWSSFMLIHCHAPSARRLTPEYVNEATPADLHRLNWVDADGVGHLPLDFNWLVGEYPLNPQARVLHYTLGTPCFDEYSNCDHADLWFAELADMLRPLQTGWRLKRLKPRRQKQETA